MTAVERKTCIGVLGFEILENIMYIRYIFVEEAARKKGVGSQMLKTAEEYAKENSVSGFIWTGLFSQSMQPVVERFFIRNGFFIPTCEERVFTLELKDMKQSYLANLSLDLAGLENHLYRMEHLPLDLQKDYELHIKPTVMQACQLAEIKGRIIPELSLAVERDLKIVSYVLFSEVQGELYLNAVYSNAKNIAVLAKLLKYCMEFVDKNYQQYKTMKVTVINEEGYHLVETLIEGMTVSSEVMLMSYKTI